MKVIGVIPARLNATRFPGKPMAKILGKPMIGHVYDNVKQNKLLYICKFGIDSYIT